MMSWLKRLMARTRFALKCAWFVLKLVLVIVAVVIPPLITLTAALKAFETSVHLALFCAVLTNFALIAAWLFYKGTVRLLKRCARFLWKIRAVRWGSYGALLAAAAFLAVRNVARMAGSAWPFLVCEAVAIAAFVGALLLARETVTPQEAVTLPAVWTRSKRSERVRFALWAAAVLAIDFWLHGQVMSLLRSNWISAPWAPIERIHVALAFLPPAVFTIFAWKAGLPYVRRGMQRPHWDIWWTAQEAEEPHLDRKAVLRFPLIDLNVGRTRVMTSFVTEDGRRAQRPALGQRFNVFRMLWTGFAFGTLATCTVLTALAHAYMKGVPADLSSVVDYQPAVSSKAYDVEGEEMCIFSLENRSWVDLEKIPRHVQEAFIAAEDKNFWEHDGLDPQGIIRAGVHNLKQGRARQGASTITAQVIKLIALKDSSQTFERKIKQFLLSVSLEERMAEKYGRRGGKERILEIYLNHVYLGMNAYGVEAAARTYFGKSVEDLDLAEAALLAGLPKAPSDDSPLDHFERAKVRQGYVLGRMVENGVIRARDRETAYAAPIHMIKRAQGFNLATSPETCDFVRRYAEREYGWHAVYKQGLVFKTTFDMRLIRMAQASVRFGLLDLERRLGFAGPEGHDENEDARCESQGNWIRDGAIEANARVIARDRSSITLCVRGETFPLDAEDVRRVEKWERGGKKRALSLGDLLTVRIDSRENDDGTRSRVALTARRTAGPKDPKLASFALQAGIVAIDPRSGEIRALVGGYDWNENQYNNATQARRQTGSSIKPYVYLAGLMDGMTAVSRVLDAPICLPHAGGVKCYKNYDGPNVSRVYFGNVDLMTALAKSLNSVSLRVAVDVGLGSIIQTMRSLGIRSPVVRVFPLAVGTPELTLWEHTAGYASILSNGRQLPVQEEGYPPGLFVKEVQKLVRGPGGRLVPVTIYAAPPRPEAQAVPSSDAYVLTFLMEGVVESGTGKRAKRLRRPVAGKTGTTNDFRDVWFMGGTADLVVGTWVGRQTPFPIAKEATGGSVALPIWTAFMENAFPVPPQGRGWKDPPRDFPVPNDVVLIREGTETDGRPRLLPFQRGKMPDAYLDDSKADFSPNAYD